MQHAIKTQIRLNVPSPEGNHRDRFIAKIHDRVTIAIDSFIRLASSDESACDDGSERMDSIHKSKYFYVGFNSGRYTRLPTCYINADNRVVDNFNELVSTLKKNLEFHIPKIGQLRRENYESVIIDITVASIGPTTEDGVPMFKVTVDMAGVIEGDDISRDNFNVINVNKFEFAVYPVVE